MASTLAEILKGGTSIKSGGAALADAETNQLLQLAQAKTGKAAASTGAPKISNIGAQVAAATGQAQAQLQDQQFEAKGQQLIAQEGAQEQAASAANAQVTEQGLAMREVFSNKTKELLQNAKQKNLSMDRDDDRAELQQLGMAARLSSEQYVEQLEREGALGRLEDAQSWERAYTSSLFDEELGLLRIKLGHADIMNMDKSEFNDKLSRMNINDALAIAAGNFSQEIKQGKYKAAGNTVSAVVDYNSKPSSTSSAAPADKNASQEDYSNDDDLGEAW